MEIFTRFLRNGTKKADVTGLEAKVYLGTLQNGTLNEVLWCPPKLKAAQKVFPHLKPSLEEFQKPEGKDYKKPNLELHWVIVKQIYQDEY